MRKLRWPLGILAILLLSGLMFASHEKPDHRRDLAPYKEKDETLYYLARDYNLAASPTNITAPAAYSHRLVVLKDIDEKTLEGILRSSATTVKELTVVKVRHDPFIFEASDKNSPGLHNIVVYSSMGRSSPEPIMFYYVQEATPMSWLDVFRLRIKMRGRDPFTHPSAP